MSYTLNIEPEIVKDAESCAMRNGTTLDAMIRACLLVFVSHEGGEFASARRTPRSTANTLKIGSMRDEITLPDTFDDAFDSLDEEVAPMFSGVAV